VRRSAFRAGSARAPLQTSLHIGLRRAGQLIFPGDDSPSGTPALAPGGAAAAAAPGAALAPTASGTVPAPAASGTGPAPAPAEAASAPAPADAATAPAPADAARPAAASGAAPAPDGAAPAPGAAAAPVAAAAGAAPAPGADGAPAAAPGPVQAAAAAAPAPAPEPTAADAAAAATVFVMAANDGYLLLSRTKPIKTQATLELHKVQPTTAYMAPDAVPPLGQYDTAAFMEFGAAKGAAWFANATGVLIGNRANGTAFAVVLQLRNPSAQYYVSQTGKIIFPLVSIIYPGSPEAALAAPGSLAALYLAGQGPPDEPVLPEWEPTVVADPGLLVWAPGTLFIDAACDGAARPAGLCARAGAPGLSGPAAVCSAAAPGTWNKTAFCA